MKNSGIILYNYFFDVQIARNSTLESREKQLLKISQVEYTITPIVFKHCIYRHILNTGSDKMGPRSYASSMQVVSMSLATVSKNMKKKSYKRSKIFPANY